MHKQQFLYRIIESTFSLSYVCNMRLMYLDKKKSQISFLQSCKKARAGFSLYIPFFLIDKHLNNQPLPSLPNSPTANNGPSRPAISVDQT